MKTCAILSVFLISGLQAAEHFWDEIPLSASTTRPSEVLDDYWNGEFLRVNREVAAAHDTRLIFFGDSRNQDMCNGGDFPNTVGAKKIATKQAGAINALLGPHLDQNIPKP